MDDKEFILLKTMQGDCYRFLSACFCIPEKKLFLEENLLNNLTMNLERVCHPAVQFSKEMEDNFSKYSNEELSIEYAKLFVGPFELLAPPYGSVYLDGKRTVMGDSTMKIIKMYEEEGLVINSDFNELPDHISVELEFMSFLIYKEIEALNKSDFKTASRYRNRQEIFLNTFLSLWVPQFCEKIKEATDNGFYKALADCTSTFVTNSLTDNLNQSFTYSQVQIE